MYNVTRTYIYFLKGLIQVKPQSVMSVILLVLFYGPIVAFSGLFFLAYMSMALESWIVTFILSFGSGIMLAISLVTAKFVINFKFSGSGLDALTVIKNCFRNAVYAEADLTIENTRKYMRWTHEEWCKENCNDDYYIFSDISKYDVKSTTCIEGIIFKSNDDLMRFRMMNG